MSSLKVVVAVVVFLATVFFSGVGVSEAGRKFDPQNNFRHDASTKTGMDRDEANNSVRGPNGSEKAPKVPSKKAPVIINDSPGVRKIQIGDEPGVRKVPIHDDNQNCQQFVPNNCCQ